MFKLCRKGELCQTLINVYEFINQGKSLYCSNLGMRIKVGEMFWVFLISV